MTDQMDSLVDSMYMGRVPEQWTKLAYPSTRGLGSWIQNLKKRIEQINLWKDEPAEIPTVVFLNRLFNPQSFLTAIKQITSREQQLELNKLYIKTEIPKKQYEDLATNALPPIKEGAYVFGFQVDGARWDIATSQLEESYPKIPYSIVPIVICKALLIPENQKEDKSIYQCPVYKTDQRSATYVFTAQLKTKAPPQKWVLAGVSIILDVEGKADT